MATATMSATSTIGLHAHGRGLCAGWGHLPSETPPAAWWGLVRLAPGVEVEVEVCHGCAQAMICEGTAYYMPAAAAPEVEHA